MRIALAVHHFPPRYSAGAELRAFRTARWLENNGHEVQVITVESIETGSSGEVTIEDDVYEGINVRRLSFNLSRSRDRFKWEYDNPLVYHHLLEYLPEIKPDIFHLISGYLLGAGSINAALSNQIPTITTLTDFWFFCPRINLVRPDGTLSNASDFDAMRCTRCKFEEQRRFRIPSEKMPGLADKFWEKAPDSSWSKLLGIEEIRRKFEERNRVLTNALSGSEAIVCPSQYLINTLISRGFSEDKLHYIQHGLDKSNWAPVHDRRSNGKFNIGYLGQIDKHKGLHILVESFMNLQTEVPVELHVYGDQSSVPHYTNSLHELSRSDPRIKFFGKYDYSQIANIFSEIEVLVIPSIWNEIGPWVMYEALETKTPVIASDIPNMADIINHEENGLLFECGNFQDLTSQLKRVIEDRDLRNKLIAGIRPVNTLEEEMASLSQVYRNVLKKKNSS